jgi:hypothetical protein
MVGGVFWVVGATNGGFTLNQQIPRTSPGYSSIAAIACSAVANGAGDVSGAKEIQPIAEIAQ